MFDFYHFTHTTDYQYYTNCKQEEKGMNSNLLFLCTDEERQLKFKLQVPSLQFKNMLANHVYSK